jgi:predicted secreted hydrolase
MAPTGFPHRVVVCHRLAEPAGRQPAGFPDDLLRVRTGVGEDSPSAFAPRQLILAHAAIADPRLGRLRHGGALGAGGFRAGRLRAGPTGVWVGDWRFALDGERYRAEVHADDFSYALDLRPAGPPLLNGQGGFSAKAADPRHASYYYSRPQLAVSGSVTFDGRTARARPGLAGPRVVQRAAAGRRQGLGLGRPQPGRRQCADGLRLRDGQGRALWAAATWQLAGGGARVMHPAEIAFTPGREWRSPRTGITYPVEWRLRVGEREFGLRPLLDDQELDSRRSAGSVYWEGGAGRRGWAEIGRGYLEMTGYGERIRVA